MKWEYKTISVYRHGYSWEDSNEALSDPTTLEEVLQTAGQEGWELVSTLTDDRNYFAELIFKRPVHEREVSADESMY